MKPSEMLNLNVFLWDVSAISSAFGGFKFTPDWESFLSYVLEKYKKYDRWSPTNLYLSVHTMYLLDLNSLINERDWTTKHLALAPCIHHYTRSKFVLSV